MIWFTATRLTFITRDYTTETKSVINAAQVCRLETRDDGGSYIHFSAIEGKDQFYIIVKEDVDTLLERMAPA